MYIYIYIYTFLFPFNVAGNRRYSAHHLTDITRLYMSYVSLAQIFMMDHHFSFRSFRFYLCHEPGHKLKTNEGQ